MVSNSGSGESCPLANGESSVHSRIISKWLGIAMQPAAQRCNLANLPRLAAALRDESDLTKCDSQSAGA